MILCSGRRQPGTVAIPASANDAPITFMNPRRSDSSSSEAPAGNSRSTNSRSPAESASSAGDRQGGAPLPAPQTRAARSPAPGFFFSPLTVEGH